MSVQSIICKTLSTILREEIHLIGAGRTDTGVHAKFYTAHFDCKIFSAKWHENEEMIIFRIKADRFLRNMVRAIVGSLLEVGKNKISLNGFRQIIESKNRTKAGMSVPAKGLFLVDIDY
ncbi:MAG: hypothetical protein HY738_19835 [Bacteroidia bacterium]|nr:hypothetical protein [Bacteroidia bacterium]